jgi:predicted RNase H-like HicB family nuclease
VKSRRYLEYKVKLSRDKETGLIVAEVPTLGLADDGSDQHEALSNLQHMVAFHLECLVEEREPIPTEKRLGAGLYIRVKLPAHAA